MTARHIARARRTATGHCDGAVRISRTVGAATFNPTTGTIVPAATKVVYDGPASLSSHTTTSTQTWGGYTLQKGQTLMRAPLDANTVRPGDQVEITRAQDFPTPLPATLWVHEIPGRQTAVLARVILTATKPGDDGG